MLKPSWRQERICDARIETPRHHTRCIDRLLSPFQDLDISKDSILEASLEEAHTRVALPLKLAQSESWEKLFSLIGQYVTDDEKIRRLSVLRESLQELYYVEFLVTIRLCAALIPHLSAESVSVITFLESITDKALRNSGFGSFNDADEFLIDALGNTIERVPKLVPKLPENWYTQAWARERMEDRREDIKRQLTKDS